MFAQTHTHCSYLQEVAMGEVHALAVLGAGGFGQVLLVRYRGHHYALKCIAKDFVIQQGLVAHIRREKVGVLSLGNVQAASRGRLANQLGNVLVGNIASGKRSLRVVE